MMKIGNIEIKNPIVLAPMAGISDPAYMQIVEKMGVGLCFTELISAEAIVRRNRRTLEMLVGLDDVHVPVGVQIFGANVETMVAAAKILVDEYHIKLIDINMGCPVPKVAIRSQAGSALLKNPDKIYELVKAMVDNVDVPITVKIRSGWDEEHINALEVAKKIEAAGAKAVTVHARTRSQGYSGKADWQIIKMVKENVHIPVIGNGDVTSCFLAKKMMDETGCDAVMIGRGNLGNPWLIRECVDYLKEGKEPKIITYEEKIAMLKKHFTLLLKYKPERVALLEIRNHALWYLKGLPNSAVIKNRICSCNQSNELFSIFEDYLNSLKDLK